MTTREALSLNLKNLEKAATEITKLTELNRVKSKLNEIRTYYKTIENLLINHECTLPTTTLDYHIKESKRLLGIALHHSEVCKVNQTIIMTTPTVFDIKQASAIVQPYDGSAEQLDSFLDAVKLLKDYVLQSQVATAIKFLKTRLTGKARIGLLSDFNTIDEFINDIQRRCTDTSPEHIIAQMKAIKIKSNESVREYCDNIEKCCERLKSIYIHQQIPIAVAETMSRKVGINTLINGINNQEVKLILKAGTFTSLAEAITKINENCQHETANELQILSFNRARGQANRGNPKRGFRGGNRQNDNNRVYNQNQNSYYNRNRYNSNFRSRGNFQRNYQGTGNYFRGRQGYNRHVYTIQAGQPQMGVDQLQQLLPGLVISPPAQNQQQGTHQQAIPQLQQPSYNQPNFLVQIQGN